MRRYKIEHSVIVTRSNPPHIEQIERLTQSEAYCIWVCLKDQPDVIAIDVTQTTIFLEA